MRVEFGFGVGFDRDNRAIDPMAARKAVKQIIVEACSMFGGCNVVQGQGGWFDHASDTLVIEDSRVLVVDLIGGGRIGGEYSSDDDVKIAKLAEYIRTSLNQAVVHVTKLVATSKDVYIHKG